MGRRRRGSRGIPRYRRRPTRQSVPVFEPRAIYPCGERGGTRCGQTNSSIADSNRSSEGDPMSKLKDKVSKTAHDMKNAMTKTADKVGHAASDAFHKADHALTD